MLDTPRRSHMDVLTELVPLTGRDIVDVGCGFGDLVRAMTRRGGRVVGIECGAAALAAAQSHPPQGEERYLFGRGESLPLADAAFDVVVFFNSLHHVPPPRQPAALQEAARVLRQDGVVYVLEPLAHGDFFELVRPVDDETKVRAAAYRALCDTDSAGLEEIRELTYNHRLRFADFAAFRNQIVGVDPARASAVEALSDRLEASFLARADREAQGYAFDVPSRVNLLRKSA